MSDGPFSCAPDDEDAPTRTTAPLRLGGARPFDVASIVLLTAVALRIVTTFRDYGITWDEDYHLTYGRQILAYFSSRFTDTSALSYPGGQQPTYGGAFDLAGALVQRVSPFDRFDTAHLFGGLVGLLGIVGAWKLGRLLMGPAGGFWSALLLTITPAYYGAMFNNPKDPPFAAAYVWALYYLCMLALRLPHPPGMLWAKLALTMGLAMGVRVAAILTIPLLLLLLGSYGTYRGWLTERAAGLRHAARLGFWGLVTTVGAWTVMVLPWPWALQGPIARPLAALAVVSDYNLFIDRRPFGDELIWSYAPPWDYLPRYLAIQLPEIVLLLVLAGVVLGALDAWRRRRQASGFPTLSARALLALAIVIPPVYAIARHSALYDGLRHLLFIVPPLCVLGGITAAALTAAFRRRVGAASWLFVGALGISSVEQVGIMLRLHPHEYVYFNQLVGGLPGAVDRYDTDYYGNGYREAFACLERRLWSAGADRYWNHTFTFSGCLPERVAQTYSPPELRWLPFSDRREADFFVAYRRNNCHKNRRGHPVLCRVERFGAPLVEVYDQRR